MDKPRDVFTWTSLKVNTFINKSRTVVARLNQYLAQNEYNNGIRLQQIEQLPSEQVRGTTGIQTRKLAIKGQSQEDSVGKPSFIDKFVFQSRYVTI